MLGGAEEGRGRKEESKSRSLSHKKEKNETHPSNVCADEETFPYWGRNGESPRCVESRLFPHMETAAVAVRKRKKDEGKEGGIRKETGLKVSRRRTRMNPADWWRRRGTTLTWLLLNSHIPHLAWWGSGGDREGERECCDSLRTGLLFF